MTPHLHHIPLLLLLLLLLLPTHTKAQRCPFGTERTSPTTCTPCARNFFRDSFSSNFRPICEPCRRGRITLGLGAVDDSQCLPCPGGTFLADSGNCTPCPAGTSSRPASTACITCGPGTRPTRRADGCEPCPRGFFAGAAANSICRRCPNFTTTDAPGATSRSQCAVRSCPPGQAPFREDCDQCSPARIKPLAGPGRCTDCPDGMQANAARTACVPCPRNQFRPRFGFECRPCRDNSFTFGPGAARCRIPGVPCPRSFFEKPNRDCATCPPGTRFLPDEARCEPCPPGLVSPGGLVQRCRPCPTGQVADFQSSECACGPGMFVNSAGSCEFCAPGTFADDDPDRPIRRRICNSCSTGTFNNRTGATGCQRCPPGTIAPRFGLTSCRRCPRGLIEDPDRFEERCVLPATLCPRGFRRRSGAGTNGCDPIACTTDTPADRVGRDCAPCRPGMRLNDRQTRCVSCAGDEVSEGGVITSCEKCPNGLRRGRNGRTCTCRGDTALGFGLQGGICLPCPPGTISDFRQERCRPCPAGMFQSSRRESFCNTCARGTFSSEPGSARCRPCPSGTTSSLLPRISCIPLIDV